MYKSSRVSSKKEEVEHEKSFKIIKEEGDKFLTRLLSKETSMGNPSFRVYYGGVSVGVPFIWESQPGTPKYMMSFSDHHHHHQDSLLLPPPLTPPPSYAYSSSSSSTINNNNNNKTSSSSSINLFHFLFPRFVYLNKSNKQGTTTTTTTINHNNNININSKSSTTTAALHHSSGSQSLSSNSSWPSSWNSSTTTTDHHHALPFTSSSTTTSTITNPTKYRKCNRRSRFWSIGSSSFHSITTRQSYDLEHEQQQLRSSSFCFRTGRVKC